MTVSKSVSNHALCDQSVQQPVHRSQRRLSNGRSAVELPSNANRTAVEYCSRIAGGGYNYTIRLQFDAQSTGFYCLSKVIRFTVTDILIMPLPLG